MTDEQNANTNVNFEEVLDKKLSVFNRNIEQKLEEVKRDVSSVRDPEEEFNEETELTHENIEKLVEKKAEEKVVTKIKEMEVKNQRVATEREWFAKALDEFPDLKDKASPLWVEAGKIYDALPPNSKFAEDVVYSCALKAKYKMDKEASAMQKNNSKNKDLNKATGGSAGEDDAGGEDSSGGLTAQQKEFCRKTKIDPKKYAERLKARAGK